LALIASTPFYLGQRAGLSVPTWITAKDLKETVQFIAVALDPGFLLWVVVLVAWLACLVGPRPRPTEGKPAGAPRDATALAGLTAVMFLPLVIIGFSHVVQPSIEDRYATTAAVALGPAVAYALARTPRVWLAGLCLLFATVGAYRLELNCETYHDADDATAALITAIRKHTGSEPVVFETIHQLFVVCRYAPDLVDRCYKLDFEEDEMEADDGRILDRDLARRFAESYSRPALLKWGDLRRLPKKYIVPDDDVLEMPDTDVAELYPGLELREIEAGLYYFVPRKKEPSPGEAKKRGKKGARRGK
jgi:hypothetical protein